MADMMSRHHMTNTPLTLRKGPLCISKVVIIARLNTSSCIFAETWQMFCSSPSSVWWWPLWSRSLCSVRTQPFHLHPRSGSSRVHCPRGRGLWPSVGPPPHPALCPLTQTSDTRLRGKNKIKVSSFSFTAFKFNTGLQRIWDRCCLLPESGSVLEGRED